MCVIMETENNKSTVTHAQEGFTWEIRNLLLPLAVSMAAAAMKSVGSWRENWELIFTTRISCVWIPTRAASRRVTFIWRMRKRGTGFCTGLSAAWRRRWEAPASVRTWYRRTTYSVSSRRWSGSWQRSSPASLWAGAPITCWRTRTTSNWCGSSFIRIWTRESAG